MKTSEMTDLLFAREMQKLLADVQFWSMRLNQIQADLILKPTPVSYIDESGQEPFPLALELRRLWNYARGTGPRPEEANEIIQELCELLWSPIGGTSYDIPAVWWETPLGQMVKMTWARMKLDADLPLDPVELALFVDVTDRRIRQMCRDGSLQAEKVKRENSSQQEWAIPAAEAKKFIGSRA